MLSFLLWIRLSVAEEKSIMEILRVFPISFIGWTVGVFFVADTITGTASGDVRQDVASDTPYFFYQQSDYPRDCKDVFDQCSSMNSSGVHYIRPEGFLEPFEVYCDNGAESSGWTVIQSRQINGSVHFDRDWDSYKQGFGFLSRDFWIGNERLSFLTNQGDYELLVEMTTFDGAVFSVSYNNFRIGEERISYRLINISRNSTRNVHITWCPVGTYYGDCTCGKRTCEDPGTCIDTCIEGQSTSCVPCPEGFYMKGNECVPRRECGCYVHEETRVIPEGDSYTSLDCSRTWMCSDGELTIQDYTECDTNAVCDERKGIRACYCAEGYTGNGRICIIASDCQDLYNAGIRDNGIYTIQPSNWPGGAYEVFCNMSDGGGWIVFQRRVDGTVDFYRGWASYKTGFGNMTNEFWLGNEKLHYLTNQGSYQMRIDFVNANGAPYYAKYTPFQINSEDDNYRLVLGTYSGTANYDALNYHRDRPFTTKDHDNDAYSNNCAVLRHGAWWYNNCEHSNLNGGYHSSGYSSVWWYNLPGNNYNIKYTEMKIRPA